MHVAPRHGCQYGQAPCMAGPVPHRFSVAGSLITPRTRSKALEGYFVLESQTKQTSCNVGTAQRGGRAFARKRNELWTLNRVGYSNLSVNPTDSNTEMKRQARRPLGRYDTAGKACRLKPCPPDFSFVFEMVLGTEWSCFPRRACLEAIRFGGWGCSVFLWGLRQPGGVWQKVG